jgi:hypothetical protein
MHLAGNVKHQWRKKSVDFFMGLVCALSQSEIYKKKYKNKIKFKKDKGKEGKKCLRAVRGFDLVVSAADWPAP